MCFDLNYAVEHGIIDVPAVRSMIEMEKRKEPLYDIPCERDMFYDRRRKFYWVLDRVR